VRLWRNRDEAFRELVAENQQFQRELVLRFERSMRAHAAEIRAEVTAQREESRRYFAAIDAKTEEILQESRAQRQALLHLLDRLGGGGTAPAT
jgi:DNA-binding transcriptional regulator WhiA